MLEIDKYFYDTVRKEYYGINGIDIYDENTEIYLVDAVVLNSIQRGIGKNPLPVEFWERQLRLYCKKNGIDLNEIVIKKLIQLIANSSDNSFNGIITSAKEMNEPNVVEYYDWEYRPIYSIKPLS